MKNIVKVALGAVMLAGALGAAAAPADARVSVGIGVDVPVYGGYYGPGGYAGYSCDPYSRWYAPAYCGGYYGYGYGYGPSLIIGGHFGGDFRGGGFHGGGFHGGGHGDR